MFYLLLAFSQPPIDGHYYPAAIFRSFFPNLPPPFYPLFLVSYYFLQLCQGRLECADVVSDPLLRKTIIISLQDELFIIDLFAHMLGAG